MKFLICLTLVICGTCGVTASTASSSSYAPSVTDFPTTAYTGSSSSKSPSVTDSPTTGYTESRSSETPSVTVFRTTASTKSSSSDSSSVTASPTTGYTESRSSETPSVTVFRTTASTESSSSNSPSITASPTPASTGSSSSNSPTDTTPPTIDAGVIIDDINLLINATKDDIKKAGGELSQNVLKTVKDFYEAMVKAFQYIINIANGNIFLNQIDSVFNQTISSVISSLEKPILDALKNLQTSLSKDLSDTSNKFENIVKCLEKNNETAKLFANLNTLQSAFKNLLKCPVQAMTNASQPVGEVLQIVGQIAQASITDINHGLECAANPIGGFTCFVKYGLHSFMNGVAQTSGIVNAGTRMVNNILTFIPENIECVNNEMSNIVQSLTKAGINATGCL